MKKSKIVHTMDIKYESWSLAELVKQVRSYVPEGTADEDIELEVVVEDSHGYYDDIIVTAELVIGVKDSK